MPFDFVCLSFWYIDLIIKKTEQKPVNRENLLTKTPIPRVAGLYRLDYDVANQPLFLLERYLPMLKITIPRCSQFTARYKPPAYVHASGLWFRIWQTALQADQSEGFMGLVLNMPSAPDLTNLEYGHKGIGVLP